MTPHLQLIIDLLKLIHSQPNGKKYAENIFGYIFGRGEIDKQAFLNDIKYQLEPEVGEKFMTLAEQFMQEGMQAEAKKVARGMLDKGFEINLIAELTGLSLEAIRIKQGTVS